MEVRTRIYVVPNVAAKEQTGHVLNFVAATV